MGFESWCIVVAAAVTGLAGLVLYLVDRPAKRSARELRDESNGTKAALDDARRVW